LIFYYRSFNGERFLKQQIDSILSQTYSEWSLFVRDGVSSDNTISIVNGYSRNYIDKIRLVEGGSNHILNESINDLLSFSSADYLMFCDQDDVWLPDKIEITLNKMKEMEAKYSSSMPILIHTDLKVADDKLNALSESFWKFQHLDAEKGRSLNRLLTQNTVTGCTMMINRALKNKIKNIPEQAIVYDWWIALIAAAFGKVDYVVKPTILYRQHEDNSIGAKKWDLSYVNRMVRLGRGGLREILLKTQAQAGAFLETYKEELSVKDREKLSVYSTLDRQNPLLRRINLLRYNFLKVGFRRNLGLFFAI